MNISKSIFDSQWRINFNLIEKEVNACIKYEIYPLFEKYIKPTDKILENGCGAGRWVIFYHRKGYDITGIDWSETTINNLKNLYPELNVLCADSRKTNFPDNYFDVILSLGTFEHAEEGPQSAIKESLRILKPNGIMICTMPYFSFFLKIKTIFKEIYRLFKYNNRMYTLYRNYRKNLILKFFHIYPSIMIKGLDQPYFFEYYFSHKEFLKLFMYKNLEILESFTAFSKDGLYFSLKNIVGKWDYDRSTVKFNLLGKFIYKIFPVRLYNLHNVVVVKKKL